MRLNRYIAQSGMTSRRKADELIQQGRVVVNEKKINELGYIVQPGDVVTVDGKKIEPAEQKIILAFYKPYGVTTTLEDAHAEKIVSDFVPKDLPRVFPVGRLDKESEGLLILTNDGDLAHELMHPSFEHEKEYHLTVAQPISDQDLKRLEQGILLEEGKTEPAEVHRFSKNSFSLTIHQGWKRQIRRMVEAVGNRVTMLQRVRIGKLTSENLKPGDIRHITREDIL